MNTTETKKTERKKSSQNGQNGKATIDAAAAAGAAQTGATPSAPSAPGAPSAPVQSAPSVNVSIDEFPADVQMILKAFKEQLHQAPVEMQKVVESYLFGSTQPQPSASSTPATVVPAGPPEDDQAQAPAQQPALAQDPVDTGYGPSEAQTGSPVLRRFAKQDAPSGFQRLPPLLMYSAQANQYAPMRVLAMDVLQWGSRPVIVAISKSTVGVVNASGEVVQAPPKTPFAIPAESDLGNFVRPLIEDPAGAYEIYFCPSSIVRDDTGLQVLRYDPIGIGARVPKASVMGG